MQIVYIVYIVVVYIIIVCIVHIHLCAWRSSERPGVVEEGTWMGRGRVRQNKVR